MTLAMDAKFAQLAGDPSDPGVLYRIDISKRPGPVPAVAPQWLRVLVQPEMEARSPKVSRSPFRQGFPRLMLDHELGGELVGDPSDEIPGQQSGNGDCHPGHRRDDLLRP